MIGAPFSNYEAHDGVSILLVCYSTTLALPRNPVGPNQSFPLSEAHGFPKQCMCCRHAFPIISFVILPDVHRLSKGSERWAVYSKADSKPVDNEPHYTQLL